MYSIFLLKFIQVIILFIYLPFYQVIILMYTNSFLNIILEYYFLLLILKHYIHYHKHKLNYFHINIFIMVIKMLWILSNLSLLISYQLKMVMYSIHNIFAIIILEYLLIIKLFHQIYYKM